MELVVSAVLAYLLSGIYQVTKDLGGRAMDRPMWAIRPTLSKALLVGATWFTRPFVENIHRKGHMARGIAFGMLGVTLQMTVLTFFIWGCILAADYFFDNALLKVGTTAILMYIGSLIVLPLVGFLMIPLTLLIAWPLDLLFPLKEATDASNIKWCRTCKHHRKSKEYEDLLGGLWLSDSMPRSDKLPCNIPLETATVWKQYFSSKPESRALFPKDCPTFEKRA